MPRVWKRFNEKKRDLNPNQLCVYFCCTLNKKNNWFNFLAFLNGLTVPKKTTDITVK